MVCNGVLPIDQLREHTGPIALVAQRIPKSVLEVIYGIKISTKSLEEGGNGIPTAEELLVAYAGKAYYLSAVRFLQANSLFNICYHDLRQVSTFIVLV
jgi:large subunit GTPase 1